MKSERMVRLALATWLVSAALLMTGTVVREGLAQEPGLVLADLDADTLMTLVPIRSTTAIRLDLDNANAARTAAEAQLRLATDLRDRSRLRIEVQKREISTLESRLKLAKKEKNAEAEAQLDQQIKRMKVRKTLLERRAELRAAEIDLAKALKSLAEATASVHEQSLALADLRAQRIDMVLDPSDPAAAANALKGRERLRDLESKVLSAQKREAERRMDASKRETQLADRRMKLFDAQIKMIDSAQ